MPHAKENAILGMMVATGIGGRLVRDGAVGASICPRQSNFVFPRIPGSAALRTTEVWPSKLLTRSEFKEDDCFGQADVLRSTAMPAFLCSIISMPASSDEALNSTMSRVKLTSAKRFTRTADFIHGTHDEFPPYSDDMHHRFSNNVVWFLLTRCN